MRDGSGVARSRMAAPTQERSAPLELLKRVALAALGAVALTGERVDELADELSVRGGAVHRTRHGS